jgi:hypothetical protein
MSFHWKLNFKLSPKFILCLCILILRIQMSHLTLAFTINTIPIFNNHKKRCYKIELCATVFSCAHCDTEIENSSLFNEFVCKLGFCWHEGAGLKCEWKTTLSLGIFQIFSFSTLFTTNSWEQNYSNHIFTQSSLQNILKKVLTFKYTH